MGWLPPGNPVLSHAAMGKYSKKRDCPATGKMIPAWECGEYRISRYACPEACPFNPWSAENCDQLLEIEDSLNRFLDRSLARVDPRGNPFIQQYREDSKESEILRMHHAVIWRVFGQRDDDGSTFAERLLADPGGDLKNDQRVLLEAKSRVRGVIMEVLEVRNDREILVFDWVCGEEIRVVNEELAESVCRFEFLVALVYPAPCFSVIASVVLGVPDAGSRRPFEVVGEVAAHHGGPREGDALGRWIFENFPLLDESLDSVEERREGIAAKLEEDMEVWAEFEVSGSWSAAWMTLEHRLHLRETVLPEGVPDGFRDAYFWLGRGSHSGGRLAILGLLLVDPGHLRLQSRSDLGLSRMVAELGELLGDRLALTAERREREIWSEAVAGDPEPDRRVPPALLEDPPRHIFVAEGGSPEPGEVRPADPERRVDWEEEQELRAFCDTPMSALAGKTPRQAVRSADLREPLIDLVKMQVNEIDRHNLTRGTRIDANFLIRELGLSEIDYPPPPPRKPTHPPVYGDEEELDAEADELVGRVAAYPILPKLTDPPVSMEEAMALLENLEDRPLTTASADEVMAGQPILMGFILDQVDEGNLKAMEMTILELSVAFAFRALVPERVRLPRVNRNRLQRQFTMDHQRLRNLLRQDSGSYMAAIQEGCRQPDLLGAAGTYAGLMVRMMSGSMREAGDPEDELPQLFPVLMLLRPIIDELDRTARRE